MLIIYNIRAFDKKIIFLNEAWHASGSWHKNIAIFLLNKINFDTAFVRYCARSCEPGSQCRPNECIFGSGKPRRVGILEWGGGVYEPGEGNGKLVYEQPWYRVDGSCHSKEGSKYVERGWKGEQRRISEGETKKQGECAMYIVICVRVYNECL